MQHSMQSYDKICLGKGQDSLKFRLGIWTTLGFHSLDSMHHMQEMLFDLQCLGPFLYYVMFELSIKLSPLIFSSYLLKVPYKDADTKIA